VTGEPAGPGKPADAPPGPLRGLTYSRRARDLARYRADPADAAISAAIAVAQEPGDPWDARRAGLDEDDCNTLLTFARRRAASALRTASLPEAVEAVHALCLVRRDRIDPRDLDPDFPLYAIRQLGGDIPSVVAFAVAHAEPATAELFRARADGAGQRTLADCALLPVESAYGLGFMDTWAEPYPVRGDLPGLAIRCADCVDRQGKYEVEALHLSDLPAVWFGPGRRGGPLDLPNQGCIAISAPLRGGAPASHALLVLVADVGSPDEAAALAARAVRASDPVRPRSAVVVDDLLVAVIGGSATAGQGPIESAASIGQVAGSLEACLLQAPQSPLT
jgi:hypothetical protein